MTKFEVRKRVTKDGKPIPLKDFSWCSKSRRFSSATEGLVVKELHNCTFSYCLNATFSYCLNGTFNCCLNGTFDRCYSGATFTGCNDGTWVVDGVKYAFPPLRLQGPRWPLFVDRPGLVKVGCEEHTLAQFRRLAARLAKKEGMSKAELKEYRILGDLAEVWMGKHGWNKVKGGSDV